MVSSPYEAIVLYEKCRSLKEGIKAFEEKPNCGLCINICPYMRKAKGYPQRLEKKGVAFKQDLKEVFISVL